MDAELKSLNILGIMSGTSLDGLDMALCNFSRRGAKWEYQIIKATTLAYPPEISKLLDTAISLPADSLCKLDHLYGKWIGNSSSMFLNENGLEANWIASHGHTVFHQPSNKFSLQIGNGNDINAITGLPVVCDFRSLDIALGGQGAPLVPVGDQYLFEKYDYCLNLGGFSNISFNNNEKRIAFDVCPVNMGLNYLAKKMGLEFDFNGDMGRTGNPDESILGRLNSLDFYKQYPPKSLGREWFIKNIKPILDDKNEMNDLFRSFYEHIAEQISKVLNENKGKNCLVTGGGAKNSFLIELISKKTKCEIIIPDPVLIDYKEALIFAFLGYLRINNIHNVFSSVTGSLADHCGGVIINGTIY